MRGPITSDSGFSLVEMLIALLVALAITGALFTLVNPARATAAMQPDVMDMQQRARMASDALLRDLVNAGAGVDSGPLSGPLSNSLPPIMPRRIGLRGADGPAVARADVVTLLSSPRGGAATTLAAGMPPFGDLQVAVQPSCPGGRPLCGIAPGMTLMVFDDTGQFDLFNVSGVAGALGHLRNSEARPAAQYAAGALVVEADVHVYYLDAGTSQLRHYDGYLTDTPVVDNVVGLSMEYFGDPDPPTSPRPPPGVENCLYDVAGTPKPMPVLATAGGSLAPLPLALFADGPWCGNGSNQYDADLLRIRQMRVTVRVQAVPATLRSNAPAFAQPGISRESLRLAPDFVTTFDVSPRNLHLGRQ